MKVEEAQQTLKELLLQNSGKYPYARDLPEDFSIEVNVNRWDEVELVANQENKNLKVLYIDS